MSDRLSAVIGDVYAAVGTPEGFGSLLRQLRVLLNASSGMLFTPFVDPGAGGFGFVEHLNTALSSQYRAYYWDKDPWAAASEGMDLMKAGSAFSDATLIAQSDLGKQEIYSDLLVPMDTTRLCASIIAGDRDPVLPRTCLSLYRGVGAPAFTEHEPPYTETGWPARLAGDH